MTRKKTFTNVGENVGIDWRRIARPQDDGYDSKVIHAFDTARGWKKAVYEPADVTLCEGQIAIRAPRIAMSMGDGTLVATPNQEWANRQTQALNTWDAGYRAMRGYLDELWPWVSGVVGKGCSSGHAVWTPERNYHGVFITIDDWQGCAQGFYHEFGHLRLESLGIHVESHDGALLLNPPDELYTSSVRYDVKRPMSAVLHGVYAWLMFTENDLHVSPDADTFRQYASHNLPKIVAGINEIHCYAKWTPNGQAFADGLFDWSDDILERGQKLLS